MDDIIVGRLNTQCNDRIVPNLTLQVDADKALYQRDNKPDCCSEAVTADTPPSTLSIREDTDRQVFGYSFDNECSDWVKVKKGEFKSLSAITIVV